MTDAIVVTGLGKSFRLPLDKAATLKHRVTHPRSSGRYREFRALDDVSFTVPKGQFLGIIGHNGSGKSTLLKLLSKIYVPDRGSVSIEGMVSPFLELGVGFNPELTARENVYLNGAVLGLTRRDLVEQRVDEILDFAEVHEFAEQKLKNFSSGMQVRLAFSVAIQANAEVLLMDEVLAVGDARFSEKCFDVFAQYKREGRTIVLVTHDLTSVQMYCDRALLLDHGRLIADGMPAEVAARYRRMMGSQPESEATGAGGQPAGGRGRQTDGIPTDTNRWGTRELEITGLRLVDASGSVVTTGTTGEPLTVEVDYTVHKDVGEFVCLLGLYRSDGLLISGPNSRTMTGSPMTCPPLGGTGTVRYVIDELSLLGAGYYLSVALYDSHAGHAFDHFERALPFHVVDQRPRLGLLEPGGRFEHVAGGAREAPAPRRRPAGAGARTGR